ncbi:MAG TPA: NAD-dependent epimerase/dehydratase family protein [Myxococcales bacterium]|nr:NAD-dependent epimerase/dehydratase family protein [Myxococcales bacterium]
MRILVSGSRGFVGTRLIPRLEAAGHRVTGFDVDSVDVSDASMVRGVVEKATPDAVVHLAAVAFVPAASRDPNLAHRVNVQGTQNVIEALERDAPEARLLLVGSSEQYAPVEPGAPALTEAARLEPQGVYAETKAAAERLGLEAAGRGLDVVTIRAFNHTGPGQAPIFVAPDFARQIALIEAGNPPTMRVGNLDSVRDFLHVDDVVDAYIRLLDRAVPADTYNIASGVGTRIGNLLESLARLAGVTPEIERDEKRWRPADARVGDSERLKRAAGWQPSRSLEGLLTELLTYWRRQIREQSR